MGQRHGCIYYAQEHIIYGKIYTIYGRLEKCLVTHSADFVTIETLSYQHGRVPGAFPKFTCCAILSKKKRGALTAVAHLAECRPAKQKVSGSISWSGHMPGLWSGPWLGCVQEATIDVSLTHQCFSSSLSPSLPLCLKKKAW